MLWAILACRLASKATARLTLTLNAGVLSGGSCCSGGHCSSPSRPRAPPPPLLHCRLGWRGSPPRSGRSASTRRCVEQPAAGETRRELIKTLAVWDWFSLWPKTEAPPQRSTYCNQHGRARWTKFTRHIWQFPIQYQPDGAFSQWQSKRLSLLDFVVLLQNLLLG